MGSIIRETCVSSRYNNEFEFEMERREKVKGKKERKKRKLKRRGDALDQEQRKRRNMELIRCGSKEKKYSKEIVVKLS